MFLRPSSARQLAACGLLLAALSIAASPSATCGEAKEIPGVTSFDPWAPRYNPGRETDVAAASEEPAPGADGGYRLVVPSPQEPSKIDPATDRLSAWRTASKDALKEMFTAVARNLGAFESAYYTYTLEFGEVPPTVQAMRDTGHIRVPLDNPYTELPMEFPDAESIAVAIQSGHAIAGDIWYRPDAVEGQVGMAGLFLDPNEPMKTKWMRRDIIKYVNEADRRTIFEQGDSREAELTRVGMEQFVHAIGDFEVRFGKMPLDYAELASGDTGVAFENAYRPGELIKESATLSPGDFHYVRIDDDNYDLIGWGETGPVYYYSAARKHWSVIYDPATQTATVREMDDDSLKVLDPGKFLAEHQWGPNETLNKLVLFELHDYAIDEAHKAEWIRDHPDCIECGSFYPYMDHSTGAPECRDAETRKPLDPCCCEGLVP